MSKKRRPRKAGRPAPQARVVYDDRVYGRFVLGWEWSFGDFTYLTFVSSFTGSVICTRTLWREWWQGLSPMAKHNVERSLVEKALSSRGPSAARAGASDADLAATYPTLHEFLTLSALSDGTPRQTSTLLVFTDGGLWKAVLNERDGELSLWATAESLQGLLVELESRLTAPVVDWRSKPRLNGQPPARGVDRKRHS